MKRQLILGIIGLLILTFMQTPKTFGQSGGVFEIKQSVIANGGGSAVSGIFSLNGTIGQAAAGQLMNGGNFSIANGFWAANSSDCSYSINPTIVSVPVAGGTGNVAVTAGMNCVWTAFSNDNWLSVTSSNSGNGNGAISYSATANNGAARSGTITVAEQTFTVNQAGSAMSNYESDQAIKPSGDGLILSNDVIQMERFLNELDVPSTASNEFQRADSAPRVVNNVLTRGDGVINAADVIQARRYLNELDALTTVGGPMAPVSLLSNKSESADAVSAKESGVNGTDTTAAPEAPQATVLRIENTTGSAGNQVTVNLRVDPAGNEAQISTALLFNNSQLTFTGFANGTTTAATQSCNLTATAGRIRCSAGAFTSNLSGTSPVIGEIQPAANQILVKVIFTINAGVAAGTIAPITFDSPSAADELAQPITPSTQAGTVTILAPTAAKVSVSGRVLSQLGRGIRNVVVTITDSRGAGQTAISTANGYYHFDEVEAGETYVFSVQAKRYKFAESSKVINVNGEINDLDFIGSSDTKEITKAIDNK
jgi:hypothetical protein